MRRSLRDHRNVAFIYKSKLGDVFGCSDSGGRGLGILWWRAGLLLHPPWCMGTAHPRELAGPRCRERPRKPSLAEGLHLLPSLLPSG